MRRTVLSTWNVVVLLGVAACGANAIDPGAAPVATATPAATAAPPVTVAQARAQLQDPRVQQASHAVHGDPNFPCAAALAKLEADCDALSSTDPTDPQAWDQAIDAFEQALNDLCACIDTLASSGTGGVPGQPGVAQPGQPGSPGGGLPGLPGTAFPGQPGAANP
jgi:hypothetical protein